MQEDEIRIISIYAIGWSYRENSTPPPELALGNLLPLGRLEEFHDLFADQLPRVLLRQQHDIQDLLLLEPQALEEGDGQGEREVEPSNEGIILQGAASWLFALPSDQLVVAIDVEYRTDSLEAHSAPTVMWLERGAYAQFMVRDKRLDQHIAELAESVSGVKRIEDQSLTLPPERHQIVIVSRQDDREPPQDKVVQQILYRVDPPFRPEFMALRHPAGLNRERRNLGAVTPYTSLLYGHPDYIENSVFLTTVQAVGTAARFRQIWHRAHGQVRKFRNERQEPEAGLQRREDMETLVDQLGNLELDLSFSVETSADLGLLIPSLRIESFHEDLYEAMELQERANRVSRMFSRLDSSIHSELTAIDIREHNERDRKNLRRDWVVSLLTLVGVPLGFIFGFLGINASQVHDGWSMFSFHYLTVYLVAVLLMTIPLATLIWPLIREFRRERQRSVKAAQSKDGSKRVSLLTVERR